jgi:hypothetical protein
VFTWVDGDDPVWRHKRDRALDGDRSGELNAEAVNRARFASNDELRYALRSLEQHADFVRHVYVVTDDQRPTWLVDEHPRLTVVDHAQIIPSQYLPVFNSHAIEAQLHRIEGLAEHYLYVNDDFFFMRRSSADVFFHANGLAKFFLSHAQIPLGAPTPATKPVNAAAMNVRELVKAEFGITPTRKFKHAPYPQLRDVHREIHRRFAPQVEATAASRFRSPTDLSLASSMHHYVAYALGRAVPGYIDSGYVDLGVGGLESRLYAVATRENFDVLCLNDNDSEELEPAQQAAVVREFLDTVFPIPSSFERRNP